MGEHQFSPSTPTIRCVTAIDIWCITSCIILLIIITPFTYRQAKILNTFHIIPFHKMEHNFTYKHITILYTLHKSQWRTHLTNQHNISMNRQHISTFHNIEHTSHIDIWSQKLNAWRIKLHIAIDSTWHKKV